jgi:acyl-CoA synthetase (AMP-forming)/AMP-acid ligase II
MAQTIFEGFVESAAAAPDNLLFRVPTGRAWAPQGLDLTYREVGARLEELIPRYRAAGYGPGHRVALLLENRPDYFIHLLALNAVGAGVVPVNPDHSPDELLYQMEHSDADLAVCLGSRMQQMRDAAARRPRRLPIVDGEDLPARLPEVTRPAADGAPGPLSEAALLYTSGTTARPKGCILTNAYWLGFPRWYLALGEMGGRIRFEPGRDRLMNPLPVYHVAAGCLSFMTMLLSQGCYVMPGRFDTKTWWQDIVETGTTIVHYIGLIGGALLNQPPVPEERQHRVKWGLGSGIEPRLHAAFEERFGFPHIEVWGMTEIGRFTADFIEPRHVGTRALGRAFGSLEAAVVDDRDQPVPRGTPGELLVRAAGADPRQGFFAGYLGDEAATELAWRGGWYHTGDVVREDESGMLFFVDRKKDIIRRSGENIASAEVEAVLQDDAAVARVGVRAVVDELREQEVLACIQPAPGIVPDARLAERLVALCLEKLTYYKAPGWIVFLDAMPMTATQKVNKAKIFSPGQDPRDRPDIFDMRSRKISPRRTARSAQTRNAE